jgi:hypothetical protein
VIQYKKFTKAQGREFVEGVDSLSDVAFDDLIAQWKGHTVEGFDDTYSELRNKVIDTYVQYQDAGGYELDIRVGLCLYAELNNKSGFTTVLANDDDIWRYLSCKVFPDITYLRYPPSKTDQNEGHRLNTKRFYLHTRRIWLKTLWWYIHLSWQGTEKTTYNVLKDFGTDTISDFIERPGKGYRLPLYRAIMKEYSRVNNKSANLFNRIQKQNLVNCRNVEPALTEGAEKGYAKRLIEQSMK